MAYKIGIYIWVIALVVFLIIGLTADDFFGFPFVQIMCLLWAIAATGFFLLYIVVISLLKKNYKILGFTLLLLIPVIPYLFNLV